ncbi:MAG: hypothetical protein K8U57_01600 [Planctomycetes bacterium]|nr:hypothetical protein [Planctomycetota bacterium]
MDHKARFGKVIVILLIFAATLGELAVAVLALQAGTFRVTQIGRVMLTGWLLWQVWDGAGWARWLMTVLLIGSAVFAVGLGFRNPSVADRPDLLAFLIWFGSVTFLLGLGLASPWVGAFQDARRNRKHITSCSPFDE